MKKGKGKVVAVVAGVCLLGVVGLTLGFWKDIAVQYHLSQLRTNPNYLAEIVGSAETSPGGIAVRQFASSEPGKGQLLKLYLAEILSIDPNSLRSPDLESFSFHFDYQESFTYFLQHKSESHVDEHVIGFMNPTVLSRKQKIVSIQSLVNEIGYDRYPIEDYPGVVFSSFNQ